MFANGSRSWETALLLTGVRVLFAILAEEGSEPASRTRGGNGAAFSSFWILVPLLQLGARFAAACCGA